MRATLTGLALSAAVLTPAAGLAAQVSYVIRLDNRPEPGFATTDQLFTTALQLTL